MRRPPGPLVGLVTLLTLGLVGPLLAPAPSLAKAAPPGPASQDSKNAKPDAKPDGGGDEKKLADVSNTTHHQVTIGGRAVKFTATAGTLVMRDEAGEAKATVFYVAYAKEGAGDPASRPLTFSFNGGPGSSSVWLHLGLLGPWRVQLDDQGFPLPPPARLIDNESSLLDTTDLVFIDPVMTGYSRPAEGEDAKQFHGLDEDIESVGEFIRLFTTREKRWASPKYLIGESYGTTRAAGLAGWLQSRHGMYLNGIMLVSSILDFQTARFDPGNDLPHVLFLPTYTATAWYHGRLAPDLQADLGRALAESEAFAGGEYRDGLFAGDALAGPERQRLAEHLSRLTGLSVDYVLSTDLRINIHRFTKELLRKEGRTVGRLDSRFKGWDRDAAGETPDFDPSYAAIQGPYTATLNDLVRRKLGFESDLPYEILTGRVQPWSFARSENRYVNVAETLRGAMTQNPALRVFVANGRYDLATPYFATLHTFAHLGLPEELRANISMGFYDAGHMMYVRRACLEALKHDLGAFYAGAATK